jgi:TP901 family phage tail tape measure protein
MASDLTFRLFGIDVNASKSLERLGEKAAATGEVMHGLGAAVATGLGVAAAAAVVMSAETIKMAANFQQQMERLHTQAGVPQAAIAGLSNAVLNLAGDVGQSPTSLAQALYHIESTGLTGARALDALRVSAEGADVGGSDLVDTTTALTSVLASGIAPITDMSAAMGALNGIVGAGDMQLQDLNEALSTGVLAVVKGYGVSLNDVGAALATFGDNNIRGANAATDLRMAVQALAVPAAAGHKELAKLGLTATSLRDAMEHHGLTGALELFVGKLKASHIPMREWGAIVTEVFGKKAGSGIAVLVEQMERYRTKVKQVATASKNFGADWAAQQKTFSQNWDNLKAKLEAFGIKLGNKLMPWVQNTVLPALNKIVDWFDTNLPTMTNDWNAFWKGVGDAFGAVKTKWDDFVKLVKDNTWVAAAVGVIGGLATAIIAVQVAEFGAAAGATAWAVALGAVDLAASPWIRLALAIGAVGGALVVLYSRVTVVHDVLDAIGRAIVWFAKAWVTVFNWAVDGIIAVLTGFYNFAIAFGRGVRSVLLDIAHALGSILLDAFRFTVRQILFAIGNIPNGVALAFGWIPGIGPKLQAAAAQFNRFADNVNAALAGIDDQSATFTLHYETTGTPPPGTAANSMLRLYANKPRFAAGGFPPVGRPVVVGENGPEIVTFPTPAHVWPNGTGPGGGWSPMPSGGGDTYNITVNVPNSVVGNEQLLVKTIRTAFARSSGAGLPTALA